jgi:hypothetical protein
VNAFSGFSVRARKINAGPRVINIYRREGGYLLTFKKDKMVNAKLFSADQ